MEGFGAGSVLVTNGTGSGHGSGCPQNCPPQYCNLLQDSLFLGERWEVQLDDTESHFWHEATQPSPSSPGCSAGGQIQRAPRRLWWGKLKGLYLSRDTVPLKNLGMPGSGCSGIQIWTPASSSQIPVTKIYQFRLNFFKTMLLIRNLVISISRKYPFRIVTNRKITWNVVVIGTKSKFSFGCGGTDTVWFGLYIIDFYAYLKWNKITPFPLPIP